MGPVPERDSRADCAVTRPRDRASRGRWAEEIAARHLTEHGLVCRERNFRSRYGEIDLVMEDGPLVVFVEVRSRAGTGFMDPAESVDRKKRNRLSRTADSWLRTRCGKVVPACRFDVVTVTGRSGDADVRWLKGAFDA